MVGLWTCDSTWLYFDYIWFYCEFPDSTLIVSDSTVILPDSTAILPDSTVILPDSTVILQWFYLILPDSSYEIDNIVLCHCLIEGEHDTGQRAGTRREIL